jgi:N-methylhydantoinase B
MSDTSQTHGKSSIDPVMTAVIANRIDGIVREMTTTLLRAGRSAVINSARDFSCAICTGDNELLACAEGLPIHIFGSHMQARTMVERHPDLAEGDAFLHNDPYSGNTHPADHTFLVPVFFEGEHLFTAVAKAHQADIGNSVPTTYHAAARDVYEEGSLIFPAVQIQRNYEMIGDIVQMCRSRIRVPNQWYGDFLAGLGAARTAERRLKELCVKYGKILVKTFIRDWLNYSELRMIEALRKMPKATLANTGRHDPFEPLLPQGIPIRLQIEIDPEQARIHVDLRDNIPNVDCGLNESEACTVSSVMAGIFNALPADIPRNAGSFRRVSLALKDGAVVGRPAFPHSCSVATTNVADRLVNCAGAVFAQLGDGFGLAEGGVGMGGSSAVISGKDHRYNNEAYVNQLILTTNGGPASPLADGWVTYGQPVCSGLMYRDSIEIDELKHPIEFTFMRLVAGSGGAGRLRGAPACETAFRPKQHTVTVIYPRDGEKYPAKGVVGGHDGLCGEGWHVGANGQATRLGNVVHVDIKKDEVLRTLDCSGGGYGNPLTRDPSRVMRDVLEGWETAERAGSVYGVILTGRIEDESLAVDDDRTFSLRQEMSAALQMRDRF